MQSHHQFPFNIKTERYTLLFIWVLFFVYSAALALLFQNLIVPNVFNEGSRLLPNDAVYFDTVAWAMAEEIRNNGWASWQLFVTNNATGNAGVLAALYAVFGHDPSVIVPINAAFHALAGVLLFILVNVLTDDRKVGWYGGLIAASLFVIFPSALSWYGQLHKDSYAIVGTYLILLVWIALIKNPLSLKQSLLIFLLATIGLFFIGMVRPYGLTLLLAVSTGAAIIVLFSLWRRFSKPLALKQTITVMGVLLLVMISVHMSTGVAYKVEKKLEPRAKTLIDKQTNKQWAWEQSDWLPKSLENYISGAASTRFSIIKHDNNVAAGSTIDKDIAPYNIEGVLRHLPRAIQVGLLAPFPSMWIESDSIIKWLTTGEMAVYYVCILGLIFLFKYNRQPEVVITLYFALAFLTILGFTMANLGTLYRVRYAYFFIILALGALGWVSWYVKSGKKGTVFAKKQDRSMLAHSTTATMKHSEIYKSRKHILSSSMAVMVLTLAGFIGFFYRDIMMAEWFGLDVALDSFFVALSIPMTVVTIMCIPLGAAFTPVFLNIMQSHEQPDIQRSVAKVSMASISVLFVICSLLYFLIPVLLPYIVHDGQAELAQIAHYVNQLLLLLFFSGPVIIGNAVLNALGRSVLTTLLQIIVPIVAITFLYLFGNTIGIQAVVYGMVIGQIANLLMLEIYMRQQGLSLKPDVRALSYDFPVRALLRQYIPLMSSAFFVGISLLASTFLAMSLSDGAVSIFNLSNKVILLITGILGAAVSAVILPYFSKLISEGQWQKARQELGYLLFLLTTLSIPFSIVMFIYVDELTGLIFSRLPHDAMMQIAAVLKYAIIQIPFFACNILLLRFATAIDQSMKVLLTAIIGLVVNIGLSMILMKVMGIEGLMLGASLAMVISTSILVLTLMLNHHVSVVDTILLLLNWLLFMLVLILIGISNQAGLIVVMLAYTAILAAFQLGRHGQLESLGDYKVSAKE